MERHVEDIFTIHGSEETTTDRMNKYKSKDHHNMPCMHRWGAETALLILTLGVKLGWVTNTTLWVAFSPGQRSTAQEAGWAPWPVRTGM